MLLGLAACSCSCSCAAFAFAGLCWYFHLGTQFNNARMPLPTLTSLFSVLLACFYGLPVLVPPVYRHPGRRRAGRHLPDYYRKPRLSPIALACGRPFSLAGAVAVPASPRGCYSRCSSEQHKSSDSGGLSSPRPGHGVVFLPLCDGTHSCSFPSSEERTMHVAVTTWPPIKRVLRLSAAPNLAWCDRHGPPRWSSPGRRGTLGLSPSSFSVLSLSFPRRSENRHPATALPVSARRCGSARFQLLCRL
jgi:hypothetical protein